VEPSLKRRPNNTQPVPTSLTPLPSEKVGLLCPRVPGPSTNGCLNSAKTLKVITVGNATRFRSRRAPSGPFGEFHVGEDRLPEPHFPRQPSATVLELGRRNRNGFEKAHGQA
jgi:hypothetical protein